MLDGFEVRFRLSRLAPGCKRPAKADVRLLLDCLAPPGWTSTRGNKARLQAILEPSTLSSGASLSHPSIITMVKRRRTSSSRGPGEGGDQPPSANQSSTPSPTGENDERNSDSPSRPERRKSGPPFNDDGFRLEQDNLERAPPQRLSVENIGPPRSSEPRVQFLTPEERQSFRRAICETAARVRDFSLDALRGGMEPTEMRYRSHARRWQRTLRAKNARAICAVSIE